MCLCPTSRRWVGLCSFQPIRLSWQGRRIWPEWRKLPFWDPALSLWFFQALAQVSYNRWFINCVKPWGNTKKCSSRRKSYANIWCKKSEMLKKYRCEDLFCLRWDLLVEKYHRIYTLRLMIVSEVKKLLLSSWKKINAKFKFGIFTIK